MFVNWFMEISEKALTSLMAQMMIDDTDADALKTDKNLCNHLLKSV